MANSLPDLVNNLSDGTQELYVNLKTMIKNVKHDELIKLNISIETIFWNTQILKMIQQNINICVVTKGYQRKFDESLKERFFNTYKFSNHDNNKFVSLFGKGVYPYEFRDSEEINNKHLNM